MSDRRNALLAGRSLGGTLVMATALLLSAPNPVAAQTNGQSQAPVVQVTLDNDGCVPAPTTGTAGPVTFQITDTTGDQVSEVELLSKDLIVGEKENLFRAPPGRSR